jgi:hypothetical protein
MRTGVFKNLYGLHDWSLKGDMARVSTTPRHLPTPIPLPLPHPIPHGRTNRANAIEGRGLLVEKTHPNPDNILWKGGNPPPCTFDAFTVKSSARRGCGEGGVRGTALVVNCFTAVLFVGVSCTIGSGALLFFSV